MQSGTWPDFAPFNNASSRFKSILPLNGCGVCGCFPSGMTRSTASAPVASTFARVVSKCEATGADRKSTRLNSSHVASSYAVFCLKKKDRQRGAQPEHQGDDDTMRNGICQID